MSQSGVKKKTFHLPQQKLTAVRSFLGARTEKEAVLLSLEEVLWRKKLKQFLSKRPFKEFRLTHRDLARMRHE